MGQPRRQLGLHLAPFLTACIVGQGIRPEERPPELPVLETSFTLRFNQGGHWPPFCVSELNNNREQVPDAE
jgi:hypothetical protein